MKRKVLRNYGIEWRGFRGKKGKDNLFRNLARLIT